MIFTNKSTDGFRPCNFSCCIAVVDFSKFFVISNKTTNIECSVYFPRCVATLNKFASQAPVLIVISEMPYVKSAAMGARVKNNDYRSIDIGITTAYLTAEAAAQGLGTCILGWFDDDKIRSICGLSHPARLVITLGYPKEDTVRPKKRRDLSELVTEL